jgi:hypothetical protein
MSAADAPPYRWPPRVLFNLDGCHAFKYLRRRDPRDVTEVMEPLAGTGVDVICALVGVNDDLSWRGSPYGEVWGETIGSSIEDLIAEDGSHRSSIALQLEPSDLLQMGMRAIIDDGHDAYQLYVDRARELGLGIFASFRMNAANANTEHRVADGRRSTFTLENQHLLIGAGELEGNGRGFNFCWQFNWALGEVHERFLGRFDEVLSRYDVDGLELDFCRNFPFFKRSQGFKHINTMNRFMERAREIVRGHEKRKGREIKLMCRVASSLDACAEQGLDAEFWIREDLVDMVAISSMGHWQLENDVARAVAAAERSGTLVYVGSSVVPKASPQEGYESGQSTVRRAIALNAYRQGAAGVHLFNYDYGHERALPVDPDDPCDLPEVEYPPLFSGRMGLYGTDRFTRKDLQLLHDLADPEQLAGANRCYSLCAVKYPGDFQAQIPFKISIRGRGAGPLHSMQLRVEDDIEEGRTSGRIRKTELRLQLTEHELSLDRLSCEVNGTVFGLAAARTIENSAGETWLVVDDPPLRAGDNSVLVILEGTHSPNGWHLIGPGVGPNWPTLERCELLVLCDEA